MKKLLTLLLTAVIGCLPMWAGAGTDVFDKANTTKGSFATVTSDFTGDVTGAIYHAIIKGGGSQYNYIYILNQENI